MVRRILSTAIVALGTALGPAQPAGAGDGTWAWPVDGVGDQPPSVVAEFDAPDTPYGAGHRGIDLATLAGSSVRAVADGVVSFVGSVAGVGVISIDHGAERSTYQPVSADVTVGDSVGAGDVIGQVSIGPFHCSSPCLHLGRVAQAADRYLDPLARLAGHSDIRLVDPDGPPPVPPLGPSGSGVLRRPVGGPITSAFGRRKHPITGKRSFHNGTDFGAPCGAKVRAAGPGTVTAVKRSGAYGLRIVVRHGSGIETFYGHLARTSVHVGDSVTAGSTIGHVGSTGLSTGCHVHFGVHEDGRPVDPVMLL